MSIPYLPEGDARPDKGTGRLDDALFAGSRDEVKRFRAEKA